MGRSKPCRKIARGPCGRFLAPAKHTENLSDSELSDDDTLLPLPNPSMDADLDYETSDESVSSSDSEKEWSAIPKPQTWDERRLQKLEKQQKIVRVASMKSAEHLLDGPVDKRGGARDKTGKKRGPYGIGGMSDRTAQRKQQKIQESHAAGMSNASEAEIRRQLDAVTARTNSDSNQRTLTSMFAPVRADPEPIEISGSSDSEPDTIPSYVNPNVAEIAAFSKQMVCKVEESSDEEVQMQEAENKEVDETVERAAEVADWVEGVLDDAAPKTSQELEELARAGLQKARKEHDYRSEVTFAGLVDFYRWMPRLGRLRSAMRVARNLQ